MNERLPSKKMILDITSMRSRAKEYLNTGKDYNDLLKTITDQEYYYNEDLPIPTMKELAELSGISYSKIRKQLDKIYFDLVLNAQDDKPFNFSKIKYTFSLKGYRNYSHFTTYSIPEVPRVGDNIIVPYFQAYLETEYFHVRDVWHYLNDGNQEVNICLEPGTYNLFWHFRKDQAEEEGEITFNDKMDMSDYQLKRKLKIGRYSNW